MWSPQEIMDLRIDAVSETASFCFLWSGSGASLQWGRACLRKWGFRRCEDICWIKSNRASGRNTHYLPESVVTPTTEHCLMGIKGTVRRNFDGHLIHANVDTDVMLSKGLALGLGLRVLAARVLGAGRSPSTVRRRPRRQRQGPCVRA